MRRVYRAIVVVIFAAVTGQAGMIEDSGAGLGIPQKATKQVEAGQPKAAHQQVAAKTAAAEKGQAGATASADRALEKLEEDAGTLASETPSKEATEPQPLDADYAVFVAVGKGDADVSAIAIGVEFFTDIAWFEEGNWLLTPYIELLAGYWEGDKGHTGISSLREGGASAYLRAVRHKQAKSWIRPYADIGLGMHYITESEIDSKELGRQWLAGSNIGAGVLLGKSDRFDIGLRIRHLSNGGTREINWGINHLLLRASVRF